MSLRTKALIFVGSSTEGLAEAERVCEFMSDDETECLLWTKVFSPGFLTFECLEAMLLECCAAVFIATPDDDGTIRGRKFKMPRANILLEFGLVAGRLGRHNIALCQYGEAELPSDLKGLTVIRMDADYTGTPSIDKDHFRQRALQQLRTWSSRTIATAERIARTDVVHGYTGRWRFNLQLNLWRSIPVAFPSYAMMNGFADLLVDDTGQNGTGFAHGNLTFKLVDAGSNAKGLYLGDLRITHEITHLVCDRIGGLDLTTQIFCAQRTSSTGEPWPELAGIAEMPEPWPFYWKLEPTQEPRCLVGSVATEGSGKTQGTVRAMKDP